MLTIASSVADKITLSNYFGIVAMGLPKIFRAPTYRAQWCIARSSLR